MQMKKILLIGLLLSSINLSKVSAQDGANANGGITIGGGGGGVTLSGNAFDFLLGNGTSSQTVARGTITTNSPWTFTQTWNSAGVLFHGFKIDITGTAYAGNSCAVEVFRSGVVDFKICDVGTSKFEPIADRWLTSTSLFYGGNGNYLEAGNYTSGYSLLLGVLSATCTSCGTSPTIAGNASSTLITVGTAPGATLVSGFGFSFVNIPVCHAYNRTTNAYLVWSATTSAITLTGTFTAGDLVTYSCFGYH